MSNVPTLLEVFIYNSDVRKRITLDCFRYLHKGGVIINCTCENTKDASRSRAADLKELNIQIEDGQRIERGLRAEVTSITERIEQLKAIHRDHMADRRRVLEDLEIKLKQNLKSNTELAAKYRHLQNEHVTLKNKMLNNYEGRVRLENTVKDLKQIKALQKRMHGALSEYFKYRGLYNQNELQRMSEDSHVNGVKVGNLQNQMDEALEKITFFLTHQLDGDSIRKMAMQKVMKTEGSPVAETRSALRPVTSGLMTSSVLAS